MLEVNKVELHANRHPPHWKEDAISSSLAWSPPTGKEPVKVLLPALAEGGIMKQPSQSSDIQVKPVWESLGAQNGLPFHFTALQHTTLLSAWNYRQLCYLPRAWIIFKSISDPYKKISHPMEDSLRNVKTWALPPIWLHRSQNYF